MSLIAWKYIEIQETRHVQSTVRQPNAYQTALSRNLPGYFITPQKYQPLSPPEIKERTNKIYEKVVCFSGGKSTCWRSDRRGNCEAWYWHGKPRITGSKYKKH